MMENSDTTMTESSNLVVGDPGPSSVEPLNRMSFRPRSNSHQEKLRASWPIVKSALEELGHSCSMDTVDSTVMVESPCSSDPHSIRKAKKLCKLICKTPVPAPLAIEMALHGRQHDVIKLGTKKGGMCNKYGINKEEFGKSRRRLKRCLKDFEDLTHCTLFLNKGTLIAVGPSPRIRWVRNFWKFSVTGKLSPAHVIRTFNSQLKLTTMMGNSDSMMIERSDFGALEQPRSDHLVSDPLLMLDKSDSGVIEQPESNHKVDDSLPAENIKCFRAISAKNQAKMKEAWPMVKSSLEELGYLCGMSKVNSTVLVASTRPTDPEIFLKAKFLVKLLCKTPVPAPLAIDLALHDRQHDLIKLGTQKDGMCKEYRITKVKLHKLRRCLKCSLKKLEDLTHCTLYLNKKTLIAVGPSPRLHWVRKVWKFSITRNFSPAEVIRVFNLQLNRTTTMMGDSDSMLVEKSDFCVLEQPNFNPKVINPFPMENSDTIMIEKRDFCILEQPKFDHAVSDPIPMTEDSEFSVLEQPNSNHEVSDPLPMKKSMCFRPSSKNRAKLKEAWPMVESSLEQLGILCTMSMVSSTISLVLPWSKDPEITRKADYLFKLLLETRVPATLAIELALHGRQHDRIKLGPMGGLRKKYGMNMEKFDKLRRGLKRSIKELEDLTHCTLFLNKNTLTAVGPSPRLSWVRRVLKVCITEELGPHHVISAFICKYDQRIANVRDLDVSNVENTGQLVSEDGAAEVTLSFLEVQATRMEEVWSMVESSLEKYGISCTLDLINRTVTLSTTEATKEYPDAFEKARHLLQLLTSSNVPPSLTFDLALNGKRHEFIKMGFQEGGLCSLYGIKKEQYYKRLTWLFHSLKAIRKLTACGKIYFSAFGGTITCVGPSCRRLRTFRKVVLACIVEDMNPAYLIRKESKWKLKESINCLLD